MSANYDLANYISSVLNKGTYGTDVFSNVLFETPDNQIAVHEYGGKPSDMAMGGTADPDALEHPSVRVDVRNLRADNASSIAYSIFKSLDGLGGVTINGTLYDYIRALQPPFILERDSKGRVTVACNYWVTKRRS